MKNHATIGEYYAHLLEQHLDKAIRKKLNETSSFKKKLAGIETPDDAKRKGYAPSETQVGELKACITKEANTIYGNTRFLNLDMPKAVQELVGELLRALEPLNDQWKKNRQFCFDSAALNDLAMEAAELIAVEHDAAKVHYFR